MEKKYLCTIRPFDCTHYRHEHQCGGDNSEKVCQYAREAPISADEIEPDMIDREILANMRRRAVEQSSFMFDGSKSEEQQEDDRLTSVLQYVLDQAELNGEPDKIKSKAKENQEMFDKLNHEFPLDIKKTLEAIGFRLNGLRYYGHATNSVPKDSHIEFGVDSETLSCKNISSHKYLFAVHTSIEVGYFIVLLQAFGIIHHRYIYERIRGIRDQFDENHNDNF